MDTTKTEQKLSDSVTNIYLKAASKGEHYQSIPTTYNKYTGYNLGTYRLNSDTQVQFVRFEPKYNDYSALYLFQKNSKQKITQPIELAFAFWEEGAQGTGSCLLVRNGTQTDIYIKQYWVNYVGSDAEIMTIADDIILYHMYPSSFNSLVLDSAQYQKWNNIFEHKRW
ncbi:hypothetical protein [Bernardetia sp.]|uniref:hypothetical protein n=1 Tax=Bernardetia sp. TaxID=1937974 RepID=UPI0025BEDF66|nr:hypothetical protein [Bernardetia sp.]